MKPSTFLDNYNIHFNVQEKQDMERDLRELVSQVTKEQREICANNITKISVEHSVSWVREAVKKAPEPEFE